MRQTYREVVRCEFLRREVFAGRQTPLSSASPPSGWRSCLRALQLGAQGKFEEEGPLRERAFEQAPATSGAIDGRPFAWIADADTAPRADAGSDRQRHVTTGFRSQRSRRSRSRSQPTFATSPGLPAALTFTNGGQSVAFIPTRYPGSEEASDPRIVMARSTEWSEPGGRSASGLGQRLLATDEGEYPLMDVRLIKLRDPGSRSVSPAG